MSENQVSQRIFTILSKNSAALQKVKTYKLWKNRTGTAGI
nr:MAG TPA: hypothetical protein [Caudoviricetes sp.]